MRKLSDKIFWSTPMSDLNQIKEFMNEKKYAIFGVSRNGKKFGNSVLKELSAGGYTLYPIHPAAAEIDGFKCFADINLVPEEIRAAILIIPPAQVELLLPTLKAAGIRRVWLQQGAYSEQSVMYCAENDISVIHHECILMFAEPVHAVHKFHGWINKILGKYPKA